MDRFDHRRIKELADAQGRRMDWLAQQTGYDPSYISRLLHGKVPMTDEAVTKLSLALQVPIAYFERSLAESQVAR